MTPLYYQRSDTGGVGNSNLINWLSSSLKLVKGIMMKQLLSIAAGAGLHASGEPLKFQMIHLKSKFKVSIYSSGYTLFPWKLDLPW